jgi:hypothetical protein
VNACLGLISSLLSHFGASSHFGFGLQSFIADLIHPLLMNWTRSMIDLHVPTMYYNVENNSSLQRAASPVSYQRYRMEKSERSSE